MKQKSYGDSDKRQQFLEKKTNSLKFYLKEIDIDKASSGNEGSTTDVMSSSTTSIAGSEAKSEFSASFLAQTNWSFVEKLLKVSI